MAQENSHEKHQGNKNLRLQIIIGLGVVIVLLGSINNRNALIVGILFVLIVSEGIITSLYIFGKETIFRNDPIKVRYNDRRTEETQAADQRIISPLAIFLKSASKGSEFSRKEIAIILGDIVYERTNFEKGRNVRPQFVDLVNRDTQFREDFQSVVADYLSNRRPDETSDDFDTPSYVASLKRIVGRLLKNGVEFSSSSSYLNQEIQL